MRTLRSLSLSLFRSLCVFRSFFLFPFFLHSFMGQGDHPPCKFARASFGVVVARLGARARPHNNFTAHCTQQLNRKFRPTQLAPEKAMYGSGLREEPPQGLFFFPLAFLLSFHKGIGAKAPLPRMSHALDSIRCGSHYHCDRCRACAEQVSIISSKGLVKSTQHKILQVV